MSSGIKLTQEQIKIIQELAGTIYDREVAKQANCVPCVVYQYRKKYKIMSYRKKLVSVSNTKLCGVVGSAKNRDIINTLDISATVVYKYQKSNNICKQDTKASDGAKRHYCSVEDLQSKLKQYAGTMTDAEAARLCGCGACTVYKYRQTHNIQPVKNCYKKRLTEEQKLKIEELLKDSSYSNYHIASMVGCNDTAIKAYRKKLGYPKYNDTRSTIDYEKIKELAGTMTDRDVAKECNCADTTVQAYRKQNNIPVFKTKSQ